MQRRGHLLQHLSAHRIASIAHGVTSAAQANTHAGSAGARGLKSKQIRIRGGRGFARTAGARTKRMEASPLTSYSRATSVLLPSVQDPCHAGTWLPKKIKPFARGCIPFHFDLVGLHSLYFGLFVFYFLLVLFFWPSFRVTLVLWPFIFSFQFKLLLLLGLMSEG